MQQVASQNAPSPAIVIPHFITGGMTWLVFTTLIAIFPEAFSGHYFNPELLAMTHLLVLGWITMVIFGALYQLIPVILEVKLFSEKLAVGAFVSLVIGTILLFVAFWRYSLGGIMHTAAFFLLIAISFFAINVFVTAMRSQKDSIEKRFIVTSVIWLLFTVIAGITLAINLSHPFLKPSHLDLLKLHAHAGLVGWFLQLIIGVGSKLLPMFMVSHNLNKKKLKLAWFTLNSGLIIAMFSLYFQWFPGIIAAVVLVVTGLILFLSYIFEAYQKRIKRKLDIGMKQSAISFLVLVIPLLLVFILLGDGRIPGDLTLPVVMAYGSTILIGFISSLILGQTYKTLPFIVWLDKYKSKVGKGKIPFPKDLYSEKVAHFQTWLFTSGFAVFLGGILFRSEMIIRIGGLILMMSAISYIFNIIKIILHKPVI